MAELRNGASPTSSQIIIYYAQKMYAYGALHLVFEILSGT